MAMKRQQEVKNASDVHPVNEQNNLESCRQAYKRAKKAYKHDKSNKELKEAKSKAKKALEEAEKIAAGAAADEEVSSDGIQKRRMDTDLPSAESADINNTGSDDDKEKQATAETAASDDKEKHKTAQSAASDDKEKHKTAQSAADNTTSVKLLEEAYQQALSAFKADKLNKDLRRAKTAARRALDEAILNKSDGKQLTCIDCSKKFIFTNDELKRHEEMGWEDSTPKRCNICKDKAKERKVLDRDKLDGRARQMCYAYQRGECKHGEHCKFSHNPEHGGKRSNSDEKFGKPKKRKTENSDGDAASGNVGDDGKDGKEGKKGWRNK